MDSLSPGDRHRQGADSANLSLGTFTKINSQVSKRKHVQLHSRTQCNKIELQTRLNVSVTVSFIIDEVSIISVGT